jgi:hypothetical protein
VTGTFFGKYIILTIIYAPPGTNGGKSTSQVAYESDSSTGTTTTHSHSFKQDYSVSATLKVGLGCSTNDGKTTCPLSVGGGGSFDYTKNETHRDALDIKKKISSVIQVNGPSADGVDHNRDEIWLFLRPKYDVTIVGTDVTWALDPDQSAGLEQYVYVGWLKDPSSIQPGILRDLQAAGITPQEYQEILTADTLAECLPPVVAERPEAHQPPVRLPPLPVPCSAPVPSAPQYVQTGWNLPYNPPFAPGDPVPLQQYSIDNSTVSTHTDSYEKSRKYGIEFDFGVDTPKFKASLTEQNSWTTTDINTTAASTGTEEKMSVNIGGPAFGYTGPANMDVYYDTLYKTFAFLPTELSPETLHGVVMSSAGKPIIGQLVTATVGGVKYRTYTNARGEYHFPSKFAGPIDLQAGSAAQHLPQVESGKSVDVRMQ